MSLAHFAILHSSMPEMSEEGLLFYILCFNKSPENSGNVFRHGGMYNTSVGEGQNNENIPLPGHFVRSGCWNLHKVMLQCTMWRVQNTVHPLTHINRFINTPVPEFIEPRFHENKPKTLVFSHRKRAFWAACFRENCVYNFWHCTLSDLAPSIS